MTVPLSGSSINLTAYICAVVNINFSCCSVRVSDSGNTDDQFSIKVMFLFKPFCVSLESFQWSSLFPHVSPRAVSHHRLCKEGVERTSFSLTTIYHAIQDAWDHFGETASSNVLTHKWPDPTALSTLPLAAIKENCPPRLYFCLSLPVLYVFGDSFFLRRVRKIAKGDC